MLNFRGVKHVEFTIMAIQKLGGYTHLKSQGGFYTCIEHPGRTSIDHRLWAILGYRLSALQEILWYELLIMTPFLNSHDELKSKKKHSRLSIFIAQHPSMV